MKHIFFLLFFYCHVKKNTIDKYNNNLVISSNHITLQYTYSIIGHYFLYASNRLYCIFERFVFQLFLHFQQQESKYLY